MSFSLEPHNKIVLVGCGFLGKYFLTRLLEGYEEYMYKKGVEPSNRKPVITIVDIDRRLNLYKFPLLDKFQNKNYIDYKWSSSGDTAKLKEEKILEDVDAIVYTAAIADVPFALRNPLMTYQVNVKNTANFMKFVRDSNFNGKFIGLSSESVYGHQNVDKLPLKEDTTKPNPANTYGKTKLQQERIFTKYGKKYGVDVRVLRSATMYGPYGRTDQALPIFITQILEGKPVTLEGDGSQTRDFVYVEDTAHAIELALYTKEKMKKGEIINIGSGKELKFLNLISLIGHMIRLKFEDIKISYKPFRTGEEGLRVWLDISKARQLLKYEPIYPMGGIDSSGLKTTIEWVANWLLNYDEKEMDVLREKMYPLRYKEESDIEVSV